MTLVQEWILSSRTVDFICILYSGPIMEALDTTTPFSTIDPMISKRLQSVHEALEFGNWQSIVDNDHMLRERLIQQGVEQPEKRDSIKWDDANLFFLSCVELSKDGLPAPLEAGLSKEKFGRFPYGDGSSISYLQDWMRENKRSEGFTEMCELLDNLCSRLVETEKQNGIGGLNLQGWLTIEEVKELKNHLTSRCWLPSAEEPLDGGCRDAAKHFVAMLRAAEKRKCGVLLRIHH